MIDDRTLSGTAASTALTATSNLGSLEELMRYYRAAEIIVSEATNSDGSIRSMLQRGNVPATTLTEQDVRDMNDFDLANAIVVANRPDVFVEGPINGVADDGANMMNIANFAVSANLGRVAQEELEERYRIADQSRREALDSFFQQRQEATESTASDLFDEDRNNSGLNDFIRSAIREIGDVGNLFLGRQRRSSDSSFVSAQRHEYDYCCNEPLRIFDEIAESADGATYLDAVLFVIRNIMERSAAGEPDADGMILTLHNPTVSFLGDEEPEDIAGLVDMLDLTHGFGDTLLSSNALLRPSFSYGNWVDAPLVRRLIARIRSLVRTVRSANVSEILELTTGQSQPEFMMTLLQQITIGNAIDAIRNFIVVDLDIDQGVSPQLIESGADFIVSVTAAAAGGGGGATGEF